MYINIYSQMFIYNIYIYIKKIQPANNGDITSPANIRFFRAKNGQWFASAWSCWSCHHGRGGGF